MRWFNIGWVFKSFRERVIKMGNAAPQHVLQFLQMNVRSPDVVVEHATLTEKLPDLITVTASQWGASLLFDLRL